MSLHVLNFIVIGQYTFNHSESNLNVHSFLSFTVMRSVCIYIMVSVIKCSFLLLQLKEAEALLSPTNRDVLFLTVWTQAHSEIEDLLDIYKVEGLGTREQLKLKLIHRMCLEENVTLWCVDCSTTLYLEKSLARKALFYVPGLKIATNTDTFAT